MDSVVQLYNKGLLEGFEHSDENGNEYEFLEDYFENPADVFNNTFLKGYQWPFDVRKAAEGSSRIDLLVHAEQQKGNRRD